MTFGAYAKQRRHAAGLTQEDMAQALGYKHRAAYSKLEARDLQRWSPHQLATLAFMLNMSLDTLLRQYNEHQTNACPYCLGTGRVPKEQTHAFQEEREPTAGTTSGTVGR